MIRYRLKNNHRYTTPGASDHHVRDVLLEAGLDHNYVFEANDYSDLGIPSVRNSGRNNKVFNAWFFHKSDINIIGKKPTIIIEV